MLNELTARLANVFQVYAKNNTSAMEAAKECENIIDDLFASLGGCELCYGAGWILIDGYVICDCKRGMALEGFMEHYEKDSL